MAEIFLGNNKIGEGGAVDTSNFYTKSEIDSSFGETYLVKISNASGYYCYVPRTMSAADRQYILSKLDKNGGVVKFAYPSSFITLIGTNSNSAGLYTRATGSYSHAEGSYTNASGPSSHAEGYYTNAKLQYQHAEGKFNSDASNAILIVGNGTGAYSKHNALEVYLSGDVKISDTHASGEAYEKPMFVLQDRLYQIDSSITALEANSGSGSADLSNYYNKSEIDSSFADTYLVKISNTSGQYYYVPRTMSDADKQAILSRANSSSGAIIFDNPINSSDNIFGKGAIMLGNSYAKGTKAIAYGYQTEATGNYTHSEGYGTKATYSASHAEGYFTIASGAYSHTEGNNTTASGRNSHAEGERTTASGESSHAEGGYTTASNYYSHAEGVNTTASGLYSHAEGSYTTASGLYSHAEGRNTVAAYDNQHVEGLYNVDASNALHIVGNGTKDSSRHNALEVHKSGEIYISDIYSSGEVYQKPMMNLLDKLHAIDTSIALALSSGGGSSDFNYVITYGNNNLIRSTILSGHQAVIKNYLNYTENAIVLSDPVSESGGYIDNYGNNSLSLGIESIGTGTSSIAHGYHVIASGNYSHAEGNATKANGEGSHAEGKDTSAYGDYSHAEGTLTSATGNYSHSEGRLSVASGLYSHAEGGITEANQNYQHVEGTCNLTVTNALHIIGNGTTRLNKHNAFEVHKSGEIFISDIYSSGEVYQKSMMSLNAKLKEIDDLRDSITTESLILDANNGINAELYIRDSNGDLYQLDIDELCQQFGTFVQG